jgi:hypothetical protein
MHSAVLRRVHTCSSTFIRLSRYVSLPFLTHRREGRQPAVPHTASSIDGHQMSRISDSVSNMYWEHRMNTVENVGKTEY